MWTKSCSTHQKSSANLTFLSKLSVKSSDVYIEVLFLYWKEYCWLLVIKNSLSIIICSFTIVEQVYNL